MRTSMCIIFCFSTLQFSSVYVMNSFGGRFDQTIGNVHTVMSLDEEMHGIPVYLLSDDSIAFILKPVSDMDFVAS